MPPITEEQVREMIQDELRGFLGPERYTFQKHIQMLDGRNIQTGRTVGTKLGTASDQLVGFWGTTAVNQPAAIADVASGSSDSDGVARTAINLILARLREPGIIDT